MSDQKSIVEANSQALPKLLVPERLQIRPIEASLDCRSIEGCHLHTARKMYAEEEQQFLGTPKAYTGIQ